MRKEIKTFHIEDINCTIEIEIMSTQKDVFDWLEQYIENLQYNWFDATDENFQILYKDGTTEYIDNFYDGHKICRKNIKSMVYSNTEDYIVYGCYEINKYGVVNVA